MALAPCFYEFFAGGGMARAGLGSWVLDRAASDVDMGMTSHEGRDFAARCACLRRRGYAFGTQAPE